MPSLNVIKGASLIPLHKTSQSRGFQLMGQGMSTATQNSLLNHEKNLSFEVKCFIYLIFYLSLAFMML